jgi:hypothetical protein
LAAGNIPFLYASDTVDRQLVFVYALAFSILAVILDVVLLPSMLVVVMIVGMMLGILAKALASSRASKELRRCPERLGTRQRVAVRNAAFSRL